MLNNTAVLGTPTILTRLRAETRSQHDAIEQTLTLMSDELTLEAYCQRLEQFYGFYKPVEDRIFGARSPVKKWLDLENRLKTPFLKLDLSTLDRQPVQQLPLCPDLPPLHGAADFFGCLYVLEGATLGGVLISRHVQKKLALTPASGGRFFYGYGQQTGAMWLEFRAAIADFSSVVNQDNDIIRSACATFEALQHWCEKK